MKGDLFVCTTLGECEAHDGQRVVVVGTYRVWDPLPDRARNHPPARQVVIELEDGDGGPFLGAWGHDGHKRPLDEIEQRQGTVVHVTGTFLRAMPPHPTDPPEAVSLAGPCIHPVESVAPA